MELIKNLNKDMKALIFDTETTGLKPFDSVILQLSYQIIDTKNWSIVKTVNHYFDWPKESWRVSNKAIEINGLTREFLATKQLSDKKKALEEFVADKNTVGLLIAHNLEFDKKFILAECKEYNVKYANSGWGNVYDTMKKTTNICCIEKYYGHGYKYPKLIELAHFLGVATNDLNLHDSSADVELTKRCFKKLVNDGYYKPEKTDTGITAKLSVESAEDFTFSYYAEDGHEISEEFLATHYSKKAVNDNKDTLIQLWANQNEEERNELKCIHCNMPQINSKSDFEEELASLKLSKYERRVFTESKPNKETVKADLELEAKENISSIMFWKTSSKRQAYVDQRLEARYLQLFEAYEHKKIEFEKTENEKEKEFNEEAQQKFAKRKSFLKSLIAGEIDTIERALHKSGIYSYPLTIEVSPLLLSAENISLEITLPHISDIPQLNGERLSSGKYKIRNLTDKAKREDYALDITGLGFYLAACYANCAPTITTIKVIGYPRLIAAEGKTSKHALYTFTITRDQLKELNELQFVPYQQIEQYPHDMNMSKTFIFKEIEQIKE